MRRKSCQRQQNINLCIR